LDELVFGIREAAWPLIRSEFSLSYAQIGSILSIPGIVSVILEPGLGILSDTGRRRLIVLGGGVAFILAQLVFALAPGPAMLLLASCALYPASGAFVSLAQATWMDLDPASAEPNMARWVVAGSVGGVVGPLWLGAAVALGFGWRGAMLAAAVVSLPILLSAARLRFPEPHPDATDLRDVIRGAFRALRERRVLRWLTLLQLTDLLQDVFLGFAALYLVDVAGASLSLAAIGIGIFSAAALAGDAVVIRILRRTESMWYLRWSAAAMLVVYPAFLLFGSVSAKLILLIPLGMLRAGWYAILQARLYAELPARSGTVVAIGAPADLVGSLLPFAIGLIAERLGLGSAMWLLLAAPIALLTLLPTGAPGER
jgi:MFS transporter, FSR family, fosmidomycin resistance protein